MVASTIYNGNGKPMVSAHGIRKDLEEGTGFICTEERTVQLYFSPNKRKFVVRWITCFDEDSPKRVCNHFDQDCLSSAIDMFMIQVGEMNRVCSVPMDMYEKPPEGL